MPPRRAISAAPQASIASRESRSDVDDELAARCDLVAHEQFEDAAGALGILEPDAAQQAAGAVHGRRRELIRVHLTEALVALHRLLPALARLRELVSSACSSCSL